VILDRGNRLRQLFVMEREIEKLILVFVTILGLGFFQQSLPCDDAPVNK